MAKPHHTMKRQPRMSGPASDCLSIMPDGTIKSFTPKPKPARRVSVVTLPNGKMIVRVSDL